MLGKWGGLEGLQQWECQLVSAGGCWTPGLSSNTGAGEWDPGIGPALLRQP